MKRKNLFIVLKNTSMLCHYLPTKALTLEMGKSLHYILFENIITFFSIVAIGEKVMSDYDGFILKFNRNKLIQNTFNNGKVLSLCVVKKSSELPFDRFSDNQINKLK